MPRRKVQFVQGGYYHIYNRGAGRQLIFCTDDDYKRCLRTLKEVACACQVAAIAYCLMPNHYHWLVRQDGETAAGDVPKRGLGSYSQAFNLIYQRRGTLFEERFKVRSVATDEYLRQLCRYIHANPVKDGFAIAPELWPYSNYQDLIGLRRYAARSRAFINSPSDLQRYKMFVLDYLTGLVANFRLASGGIWTACGIDGAGIRFCKLNFRPTMVRKHLSGRGRRWIHWWIDRRLTVFREALVRLASGWKFSFPEGLFVRSAYFAFNFASSWKAVGWGLAGLTKLMRKTPIVYFPASGNVKRVASDSDVTRLAWNTTLLVAERHQKPHKIRQSPDLRL